MSGELCHQHVVIALCSTSGRIYIMTTARLNFNVANFNDDCERGIFSTDARLVLLRVDTCNDRLLEGAQRLMLASCISQE